MSSPSHLRPGSLARPRGGANAEQSLVERINEDPTVLGLGNLDLKRASSRSTGGRSGPGSSPRGRG